ncbi:HEPN domain-containing protein [Pseudomonas sp. FEN]|uniref:ApeA N-terminal domain 1-containing protein n=1 Tax=Pseudomonas sp. FEN TaxID=2767468 RepID=UPI00174DC8CC|nr:HEPN domain-containing protein [Pseudomonas sp. FEN]
MTDEIDFSKQHEYDVEIYYDNHIALGNGTLSFGGGSFIHINHRNPDNFIRPEGETTLNVKTKTSDIFTLFNCKYGQGVIYSDFLIAGSTNRGVTCIGIRYSDISEWFLYDQRVNGYVGESIVWTNLVQPIAVSVETDEESFSLTSETIGSINKRGEDRTIHEHVNFLFKRNSGEFSLADLKKKPLELSNLLSIFIAYPLSIISMWVSCDNGHPMPAYFPSFKKIERNLEENSFERNALISRSTLDNRWQVVFDRYYNSKYRKVYWTRLAAMQRHEGFWEYRVLGYVSFLDGYVTELAKTYKLKTGHKNEKLEALTQALKTLQNPLNQDQHDELAANLKSIFPPPRGLTFSEKYNYAVDTTDSDIMKVINLSTDDFKSIKYVRDQIAHGNAVDSAKSPYEKIHSITEKLALLLTYWALIDFGITPNEFTSNLIRTNNTLKFNNALNLVHLERITNSALFISVSEETYSKLTSNIHIIINACFTQNTEGEIQYSEQYASVYLAWYKKSAATPGLSTFEEIFGVTKERVKYWATAYLECADKRKEIFGAYVINI